MSNRNNTEETASMQGVLIELFGIGIVITGGSGIGKSECGLELVTRGHKLVADDSVDIIKAPDGTLYGKCPDVTKHFMEIRGIGVVNVKSLFGSSAVSDGVSVDIIVELIRWEDWEDPDRNCPGSGLAVCGTVNDLAVSGALFQGILLNPAAGAILMSLSLTVLRPD